MFPNVSESHLYIAYVPERAGFASSSSTPYLSSDWAAVRKMWNTGPSCVPSDLRSWSELKKKKGKQEGSELGTQISDALELALSLPIPRINVIDCNMSNAWSVLKGRWQNIVLG